jgi:tryptophan synthase alpha chain
VSTSNSRGTTALEDYLRARRTHGKLLMPYLTGGISQDWTSYLHAFAEAGADAIEVGLPFSDPTLDGATIQEASDAALTRGATPSSILADLTSTEVGVPLVASTYTNVVLRTGAEQFCTALRAAGITGLIVPDLPLEEAAEIEHAAATAGVALALLATPATPDGRVAEITSRSRGFVYAVSLMGTTGERDQLPPADLTARLTRTTDRPVLLGFGITTPQQAATATRDADGVIVGAAIMRQVLDGATPAQVGTFVATLRAAV